MPTPPADDTGERGGAERPSPVISALILCRNAIRRGSLDSESVSCLGARRTLYSPCFPTPTSLNAIPPFHKFDPLENSCGLTAGL